MLEYRDWYGTQYWSERQGYAVRYVVVHDTEGPRAAAFAWWSSPSNPYKSSAHDLIDATGVVWRCVPYDKAAHHVGGASIPGFNQRDPATGLYEPNANLASIGVELEYPATPASPPWPQAQLDAAIEHIRNLVLTYQVPQGNLFRHADLDPQNRSDPRNLPWDDLVNRVFQGIDEGFEHMLRNAAWGAGGLPFNRDAAFPRYAREHSLGNPETREFDFDHDGQHYRGQGFSKAIIYAPIGHWDEIKEVPW